MAIILISIFTPISLSLFLTTIHQRSLMLEMICRFFSQFFFFNKIFLVFFFNTDELIGPPNLTEKCTLHDYRFVRVPPFCSRAT